MSGRTSIVRTTFEWPLSSLRNSTSALTSIDYQITLNTTQHHRRKRSYYHNRVGRRVAAKRGRRRKEAQRENRRGMFLARNSAQRRARLLHRIGHLHAALREVPRLAAPLQGGAVPDLRPGGLVSRRVIRGLRG